MAKMKFEIVTAEKVVYSADVDVVVAPGIEGQLGILPHHAPLMTMLQPGELLVRKDGEEELIFISGGFLEVRVDKLVVLADTAEKAEEIDVDRAEAARRRAEERLAQYTGDVDLERARASMLRSLVRLKVAEKRRKKRGRP